MAIPVCLADDLISDLHRGTTSSHFGVRKLSQLIRTRYFVPDLKQRAKKIVRNCGVCTYYKPKVGTLGGSRPDAKRMRPRHPGDIWAMDHIQITSTPDNHDRTSLLCFVDLYSNFVICRAVPKTLTAQQVASIFLTDVIARFGIPRAILSDNGSDMDCKLWRETANLLGITKLTISAGSAKSNGICEKIQGLILQSIKNQMAQYRITPDHFADVAVWAALAHNSTPFQDIDPPLSPAEIFLGRSISESTFFGFANAAYAYKNLEEFNRRMVAAQMTISEIIGAHTRYLSELKGKNTILKSSKWDFPIGTLVALKDKTQGTQGANVKLRPRYRGVFVTVKQTDTACFIRPYSSETIMRDMECELDATKGRGPPIPRYKVMKVDKGDLKKIKHLVFYSQPMARKFAEHLTCRSPNLDDYFDIEIAEECPNLDSEDSEPEDQLIGQKRNAIPLNRIDTAKKLKYKKSQVVFDPEW